MPMTLLPILPRRVSSTISPANTNHTHRSHSMHQSPHQYDPLSAHRVDNISGAVHQMNSYNNYRWGVIEWRSIALISSCCDRDGGCYAWTCCLSCWVTHCWCIVSCSVTTRVRCTFTYGWHSWVYPSSTVPVQKYRSHVYLWTLVQENSSQNTVPAGWPGYRALSHVGQPCTD
jgi:hypothetical protein